MSDEISIKVTIADRIYPLTIPAGEEEKTRKAARWINEKLAVYKEEYGFSDKHVLLSMVALEMATELMDYRSKNLLEDKGITEEIKKIHDLLDEQMKME